QYLQFLQDYRMIVFGPLLVLLIIFVPDGIVGSWNKRRVRRHAARQPGSAAAAGAPGAAAAPDSPAAPRTPRSPVAASRREV
ncbi:MAG: hypothetical protein ACLGHY_00200, partial [Gammaproteobacteria bacterium]